MIVLAALTVPNAVGNSATVTSLLPLQAGIPISIGLSSEATASDVITVYGTMSSSAFTVSDANALITLNGPIPKTISTLYPYLFARRTAVATNGITLFVSGQETAGTAANNAGILVLPSVAALAVLAGQSNGATVKVTAPRDSMWTLDTITAIVPDPLSVTNVVAMGGGYWVRDLVRGAAGAAELYSWYVDPTVGDDAADGLTQTTPLQTLEELAARIGDQIISGDVAGTVIVTITGASTGLLALRNYNFFGRFANSGGIAYVGERTVVAAHTLSGVTAWNDAAGTFGVYTLSGAPNITALGYLGRKIRISTGPRVGWKATIALDLGGGRFRATWGDQITGLDVEPLLNDTVQIYDITKIGGDVYANTEGGGWIYFQDCDLGNVGANHSTRIYGNVQAIACRLRGCDWFSTVSDGSMTCCSDDDCRLYGEVYTACHTGFSVGGTAFDVRGGGVARVTSRLLVINAAVTVGHQLEGPGVIIADGPIAVENYTPAALYVLEGSMIKSTSYVNALDAVGANAYKVFAGGSVYFAAGRRPAVIGVAPAIEWSIGGANLTGAAVGAGYVNSANLANAVTYA